MVSEKKIILHYKLMETLDPRSGTHLEPVAWLAGLCREPLDILTSQIYKLWTS